MILVAGATGNIGREVVHVLLSAGEPVHALSRNPEQATLPHGAEPVAGDLNPWGAQIRSRYKSRHSGGDRVCPPQGCR
jgi:uncharacterized protein YbjT (DUF2867 family)